MFAGSSLAVLATGFAQALSTELDAIGVVDDAVEDGVGDGGVADDVVPVFDRQLAGNEDRSGVVAILDDLEEIAPLVGIQGFRPPVVDDEKSCSGDRSEDAGISSIATRQSERCEQSWRPMIDDGEIVPAGFVAERAGQVALADAARTGDQKIAPIADLIIGRQLLKEAAIESAGGSIVDVLDAGCLSQLGGPKAAFEAFLLS